jgi:hypothetical protein
MSEPTRMPTQVLGAVSASPPRRVNSGAHTGPPVETGWTVAAPEALDDLTDVDAPAVPLPAAAAVLVRGLDGVYRPMAVTKLAPAQRGSIVHYLEQDPVSVPPDAAIGDYVTVIAGDRAGSVYHVEES